MLSATQVLNKDGSYNRLEKLSLPESRFKKAIKLGTERLYKITCKRESIMYSPDHDNYAWYLVFKLEDSHVLSNDDATVFTAQYRFRGNNSIPITQNKHDYVDDPEKSWVEKRDDGWLEARLTKPMFKHHLDWELTVAFYKSGGGSFNGMIVEGVEFRPVVVDNNGYIISGA